MRKTLKSTIIMPIELAKKVSNIALENGGKRNAVILKAIESYLENISKVKNANSTINN